MAKSKKISLKNIVQTHAQLETESVKSVSHKLSEIIAAQQGVDVEENFGPYRTKDASVYEDYVRNLSRADLEMHCEKVGVIPAGQSTLIARKLVSEFKRFFQGNAPVPSAIKFTDEQKAKFKSIKF